MILRVLTDFEVETPSGTLTLREGQRVKLSQQEAIPLIEEGKIIPVGRVAIKVWSEVLGCHLWVTADDEDMKALRSQGVSEAIYTGDEVRELNGLCKDSLKEIHKVKETFENSKVEQIEKKGLDT
jgi:hypothetical protein